MGEQKTKPTEEPVDDFLNRIQDEQIRRDCFELVKLIRKLTGEEPRVWGDRIVGFGKYHYRYDSGHEGYSCLTGFSPRKRDISLYIMPGYSEGNKLLEKLGKHKAGKGCLYITRLKDVDLNVLRQVIKGSVATLRKKYPN